MSGPHDTSPERIRQIAEDLSAERWHAIAGTLAQLSDELTERREVLSNARRALDLGVAIQPGSFVHGKLREWFASTVR